MANWDTSYNWMMDNEDPARAYAVVPDAPPGAFAVSGINSAAFPGEFEAIAALAHNERALAVEQFYERNFWNPYAAQITSDEIAKRWLDAAVNMGPGTAVKLLQQAVNWSRDSAPISLVVDGQWGPRTVEEVNKCNQDELVSEFQQARIEHYQAIVAANPAKEKYLAGWLARARK
jgi:lysozyme family protein